MDAACKDEHRRRQAGKPVENVRHALDEKRFHVAVQDVVFLNCNCREPALRVHFRRREHHAAQAVSRADVDLVRARDQHADVDDVPHAPGRRAVFQTRYKGRSCFHVPKAHHRAARIVRCDTL